VRVVARTAEVGARWGAEVVIDRGSPAASVVPQLEAAGVHVRQLAMPEFCSACGDFYDAALTRTVAHRGDYRLSEAVAAASRRNVGDKWAWRRRGGADISPLIAATLARWGAVTATVLPEPAIY
jgi:hypothetical protein